MSDNKSSPSKSNSVYIISIAITFAIVAWDWLAPDNFGSFANSLFGGLTKYFGWGYLLTMNSFVIFCIAMAFSRFKHVRLCRSEDRP